jgi:hypothetical protein
MVCQDVYVASRCSEDKELLRTYLGVQDQDSVTAILYQDHGVYFGLWRIRFPPVLVRTGP